MIRISLSLFGLLLSFCVGAQDVYHTDLVNQLLDEYNLENATYVFYNNEVDNLVIQDLYGSATLSTTDITSFSFSKQTNIDVSSQGSNPWDAGFGAQNKATVSEDDIIICAFWARRVSEASDLFFFMEDADNFDKEVYAPIDFTQDWSQYFIAIKASKTFGINKLKLGFHLAGSVQNFDIAGFTALNYGDAYNLADVPSLFNPANYGGHEEDAAWRSPANDRIEQLRKANLTVKVVDMMGNPVPTAAVDIDMTKHEFGFGTAVVGCRFVGNDCYNQTYMEKLTDLDGEGHGFNMSVTENALKWDGWEEEWIGSPEETKSAVTQLDDLGIEVRGHTMIWPGWNLMPEDMVQNMTDQAYMKDRIYGRIETMLQDEILGEIITEWDVINEITTNRDLEFAFANSPGYVTGRELYVEIFNKVTALKPDNVNYINDYITLSNGGFGESTVNLYKQFLQELKDGGAKLDGIGFQAHIGPLPTSLYKVKETLDEFDELYDVDIKITEYDIDDKVEPVVQASYMTDFLTMTFSHPKVNAFIMWGFWDGNHWKGNAPMFDQNWNLKPSGEAFNDLVFGAWWTDESGSSDENGVVVKRVFKGEHDITVNYNNQTFVVPANITQDQEVIVMVDPTRTEEFRVESISVTPNPNSGNFRIDTDFIFEDASLVVKNMQGQTVYSMECFSGRNIQVELTSGMYILELMQDKKRFASKLIIQ